MTKTNAEQVAERFPKDTEGFVLTVLHEQGDYRHLRFQRPGERWGSTDIHTWPGGLTTAGDMADGWMFERGLGFFGGNINLHYWHEKLTPAGRLAAEEFSEVTLRSTLTEAGADLDIPEQFRAEFDEELNDLIERICSGHADTASALEQIAEFVFECESEDEAHDLDVRFTDSYELNIEDYSYHFVWALHVLSTAARWLAEDNPQVIRPEKGSAEE